MKLPLLHRLTAWLCLALVLLTGLTPAQGFVVCIEDDGCVSIEIKDADASCGGCEGHDESDTPASVAVVSSSGESCPCIDLALPCSREDQIARARSVEVQIGAWIAPPPEIRFHHATPTLTAGRGPPRCIPRVSDSLAHLRSVVLLV